jgi:uncharacterized membrane protein
VYHSSVETFFAAACRTGTWRLVWPRAFLVASVAWVIVLPLAPLAASQPHESAALFSFAYGAYAIGSIICHQIGARSFHLGSAALPVCARCTGIYIGAAVTAVAGACFRPRPPLRPADGEALRTALFRRVLLLAVLPTAATLAYEWTTGIMPPNVVRALAGAPIGAAVAWIIGEVN